MHFACTPSENARSTRAELETIAAEPYFSTRTGPKRRELPREPHDALSTHQGGWETLRLRASLLHLLVFYRSSASYCTFTSKRSSIITLFQALTKSCANFCFPSSAA